MKKTKILIAVFILTGMVMAQKPVKKIPIKPKEVPASPAKTIGKGLVDFEYTKFDFGNLNEKGGKVFHDFMFTNAGNAPITIVNVVTSCGCTSTDWTRVPVNPGEKGVIKASFDPNGRQGKFNKSLMVQTDGDPAYLSIEISGFVFPSNYNFADTYKYQYGNLAVKSNTIDFNNVKNTAYDSTLIGLYNMSNKRIYVYKIEGPGNMLFTKPYDNILPNTDLNIKLKYYPRKPMEYGPVRQEIKVYTNDDSLPVKTFYVSANIVEDFGILDKSRLKKSPKADFNKTEIDLGKVSLFSSPVATFTITNKGKEDLIIRRVVRACNCLVPELDKTVIPKGKTATLKVAYSLANMAGPDSKTIKVITNDPLNTEITLTVKIDVVGQ
ncbi:MAG: DUF1573 domain-containing protein [Bacteroidota bacterium]|nr:DUF1573 domain-containing protein [Bacteroidota bacterium]